MNCDDSLSSNLSKHSNPSDCQKPFLFYNRFKPSNLDMAKEYVDFAIRKRVIIPNLLEEMDNESLEDPLSPSQSADYDFSNPAKDIVYMKSYLNLEKERRKDPRMAPYLWFDSMFECGNLSKVIALSPTEYNLYLCTDTNSVKQAQWFYFSVVNTKANTTIKFNIMNQTKHPHFYNKGMKPLVFSEKDNNNIYASWTCHVDNLSISRNTIQSQKFQEAFDISLNGYEYDSSIPNGSFCYSVSFTHTFKHDNDKIYFAYNKPYSFSRLNRFIKSMEQKLSGSINQVQTPLILPEILIDNPSIFYKREILCYTLAGIPLYGIIITNNQTGYKFKKKYVVITARVHSSETPGSYKVQGILKFLVSNNPVAESLRNNLIFLIVPMLNPDGVILGNNRCSLGGYDLNRCWGNPSIRRHPTVFAIKQRMQQLIADGNEIMVYCDLHGHSKLLNSFMYACHKVACGNLYSWTKVRFLPRILRGKRQTRPQQGFDSPNILKGMIQQMFVFEEEQLHYKNKTLFY